MRKIVWAAVLALVAAACSGGDSVDSPTTTAAPASSIVSTTAAAVVTSTSAPATTTTTTAVPLVGPGVELLVAGPDGVFLVEPDGSSSRLVTGPAVFAVDDLDGGLLFQTDRFRRQGRSVVYRVRAGSDQAVRTLIPAGDQSLALNGMAIDDGAAYVYYSREEGTTVEDTRMTLRRFDLATREVTELSTIGAVESGAFPVSVSESLILYNWAAEASHGMYFTDLQANTAAVAANPTPENGFSDCSTCPDHGELSHDGTRLVYWEFDNGEFAVIRHVASGAEIKRISLPFAGDDETVVSFDMSATHLVMNLADATDSEPTGAWVYDLSQVDPEPVILAIPGEAYLTLAPVTVQGPIPAP